MASFIFAEERRRSDVVDDEVAKRETLGIRSLYIVSTSIFIEDITLPHEWIAELKIFVQVVQAVEEVPHVTSQHGKNPIVTVLTDEIDEVNSHLIHELHL